MRLPNSNKVFMIGWEYPPYNSGGLGVACQGLTEALAARQTQIHFSLPYQHTQSADHMSMVQCTDPTWSDKTGSFITQPPFSVYDSTEEAMIFRGNIEDLDQHKLRALPQSELETKVDQYAEVVSQAGDSLGDDFEIIHAHDWMSFPAGMKLKAQTGKPLITHIHSTEFDRSAFGTGSHYISQTEYQGLQAANKVIAVSEYTRQLLIRKYGVDPGKVEVVHNGITPLGSYPDKGNHHFAQKRPVVAFMGRLTLHKGVDYFIQVAQRVVQAVPDVLFIIAGSGDMYHELLFQTARQGLSASVLFSGFIRDNQKEKLLNRADVFLMPSVSEPFGLVALEAAQRHIPVIISKNAGVSEVMSSSIAVDFWDADAMSAAVVELLRNNNYAQQVRDGQLNDLDKVTWDNAAEKVAGIYRRAFTG